MRLFKLDLSKSLMTIDRESLLRKLSDLVLDKHIMKLIAQFVNITIYDDDREIVQFMNMNIPLSGFLTEVLLNYALIDFDKEFQRVFPDLDYTRYIHEVLISFPTSESMIGMTFDIFEEKVVSILEQLNLDGQFLSRETHLYFVMVVCQRIK